MFWVYRVGCFIGACGSKATNTAAITGCLLGYDVPIVPKRKAVAAVMVVDSVEGAFEVREQGIGLGTAHQWPGADVNCGVVRSGTIDSSGAASAIIMEPKGADAVHGELEGFSQGGSVV